MPALNYSKFLSSNLVRCWHSMAVPAVTKYVRFSNRPFGVKRFQTIHHYNVAHGLVLLFGIGTKARLLATDEGVVRMQLKRPLSNLGDLGVVDLDLVNRMRRDRRSDEQDCCKRDASSETAHHV